MSHSQLDRITATQFDHVLRYHVTSSSRPFHTHLCELDSFRLNGRCSCENFQFNFEPLLARGITPEQALAAKAVRLTRKNQPDKDPRDALRCDHLIEARRQFTDDITEAIHKSAKAHAVAAQQKAAEADTIEARRAVSEEIRNAH